jgi:hypothetical protein
MFAQIPLCPPFSKGDERGILFARLVFLRHSSGHAERENIF